MFVRLRPVSVLCFTHIKFENKVCDWVTSLSLLLFGDFVCVQELLVPSCHSRYAPS